MTSVSLKHADDDDDEEVDVTMNSDSLVTVEAGDTALVADFLMSCVILTMSFCILFTVVITPSATVAAAPAATGAVDVQRNAVSVAVCRRYWEGDIEALDSEGDGEEEGADDDDCDDGDAGLRAVQTNPLLSSPHVLLLLLLMVVGLESCVPCTLSSLLLDLDLSPVDDDDDDDALMPPTTRLLLLLLPLLPLPDDDDDVNVKMFGVVTMGEGATGRSICREGSDKEK